MKIGINSWSFPTNLTLEETFKLAKEFGYDTIELNMAENVQHENIVSDLGLQDTPHLTTEMTQLDFDNILALSKQYDLPISSIATALHWQYPLNHADQTIREKGKNIVKQMIVACQTLGGDTVLIVPGVVTPDHPYDACYDLSLAAFKELAPFAEEHGIKIGIENVWNKFLLSPLEMKQFVEAINHPYVGVYFDAGNVLQFGYPDQWVRILDQHIVKVHVKDFDTNIGNITGFKNLLAGSLDWQRLVQSLRDIRYDGPLTAELSPYKVGGTQLAKDTAEALRIITNL
ncbi:MAG: sugar phosphate isomerase/epimerase family protein [Vagococcus sp.]|nr:sugar phosphate isomerase/epimerase family protein [Vagococcus sp.]